MIVDSPKIVPVRHGRERAVKRKNLETVTRQIEFTNDLRPQQRNYVRANRELESGKDLFRDTSAPEHMTAFEYEHAFAGAREIGRVHQSVVTAADDNDVVVVTHCCSTNFSLSSRNDKLKLVGHCLLKIGKHTYNRSP